MADRDMSNKIFSFDKMRKFLSMKVAVGATGALTLDAAKSKGIASVTRNSAGNWTVQFGYIANGNTFQDRYNRLVGVRAIYDTSGVGANTPRVALYGCDVVSDTTGTDGKLVLLHTGPTAAGNTAATAVDPANGEVVKLVFEFADSDAP
jgi:hypothetical protein